MTHSLGCRRDGDAGKRCAVQRGLLGSHRAIEALPDAWGWRGCEPYANSGSELCRRCSGRGISCCHHTATGAISLIRLRLICLKTQVLEVGMLFLTMNNTDVLSWESVTFGR